MGHSLQTTFASAEGEEAWCADLRALFEAGQLDRAEAVLQTALEGLEGDMAAACRNASRAAVVLTGWPELIEAITLHEGDPVTGVTLAVSNELDLAFEKGQLHHPYLMLGIYTDEGYAFTRASRADLLAQCHSECPEWAGHDEDIEVYLDIEGLDALNTLLLHHKQRFFIRDGDPDQAPLRYVEFVLGCWWRALRFHQAVATEYALHGLPGMVPVVSGMVEMRPEVVAVHGRPEAGAVPSAPAPVAAAPEPVRELVMAEAEAEAPVREMAFASLDFIPRKVVEEVKEFTGSDLRRRLTENAPAPEVEEKKPGFFARLFGRG